MNDTTSNELRKEIGWRIGTYAMKDALRAVFAGRILPLGREGTIGRPPSISCSSVFHAPVIPSLPVEVGSFASATRVLGEPQ